MQVLNVALLSFVSSAALVAALGLPSLPLVGGGGNGGDTASSLTGVLGVVENLVPGVPGTSGTMKQVSSAIRRRHSAIAGKGTPPVARSAGSQLSATPSRRSDVPIDPSAILGLADGVTSILDLGKVTNVLFSALQANISGVLDALGSTVSPVTSLSTVSNVLNTAIGVLDSISEQGEGTAFKTAVAKTPALTSSVRGLLDTLSSLVLKIGEETGLSAQVINLGIPLLSLVLALLDAVDEVLPGVQKTLASLFKPLETEVKNLLSTLGSDKQ